MATMSVSRSVSTRSSEARSCGGPCPDGPAGTSSSGRPISSARSRPVILSKARFTARNTRSGDSTTEAVGDASNINPKSISAMANPLQTPYPPSPGHIRPSRAVGAVVGAQGAGSKSGRVRAEWAGRGSAEGMVLRSRSLLLRSSRAWAVVGKSVALPLPTRSWFMVTKSRVACS